MKMSMPLRHESDVQALLEGLASGVIDCIASDHAPHETDSKTVEFSRASFGITGLQTTVPLVLQRVRENHFSLLRAIEALTTAPAECFNLRVPKIAPGESADLTVIDLTRTFRFTEKINRSKSVNSPFLNQELTGCAVRTIFEGRQVFSIDEQDGEGTQ